MLKFQAPIINSCWEISDENLFENWVLKIDLRIVVEKISTVINLPTDIKTDTHGAS